MKKYVIANDKMGIYVGEALGLAFWSKLDAIDQPMVPVWDSVEAAEAYLASWDDKVDVTDFYFPEVEAEPGAMHVDIETLKAAGMDDDMLGDLLMKSDHAPGRA